MKQRLQSMQVEYPQEEEIQMQRQLIIEKAMPRPMGKWEQLRSIYWGPGLKAIFYHSQGIWGIVAFLYAGLTWLCRNWYMEPDMRIGFTFLAFPICFLTFAWLSCWMDEQEGMEDLKGTLHYSLQYLAGLRMLYSSIFMILLNVAVFAVFGNFRGKIFWSIALVGSSSVFLFATICVYAYRRCSGSIFLGIMAGAWICLSVVVVKSGTKVQTFVFETVPLAVHGMVTVCCFALLFIYIGKVEKKDAYSFAY